MSTLYVKPEEAPRPWNGEHYYHKGARCYHMGRTWRATVEICNPAFMPGGLMPYGWEADTELTPYTTRQDYHVRLADSYARSAPYGGNQAILDHLVKVARMADAHWPAHRAGLLEASGRAVTEQVEEPAVSLAEVRHNLGLEADILEESAGILNNYPTDLAQVRVVRDRLTRASWRMRQRERGERA